MEIILGTIVVVVVLYLIGRARGLPDPAKMSDAALQVQLRVHQAWIDKYRRLPVEQQRKESLKQMYEAKEQHLAQVLAEVKSRIEAQVSKRHLDELAEKVSEEINSTIKRAEQIANSGGPYPDALRTASEERSNLVQSTSADVRERLDQIIKNNRAVLFMKGTPQLPQCGFSTMAVQMLRACGTRDFHSVDVLKNPDLRQGIKEYANWPTIPQLYVDGEFVGGSDIMREMYQSGELQKLLEGLKQQA